MHKAFWHVKFTQPLLWANLAFAISSCWVFISSLIGFLNASPVEKLLSGLTQKIFRKFHIFPGGSRQCTEAGYRYGSWSSYLLNLGSVAGYEWQQRHSNPQPLKWLQLDSNLEPLSSYSNTQPFRQIGRPVWPNGWVFVNEVSGSAFESSRSHLNFRSCACFKQGVPWHSGNYRVWIHSETSMWHDKNIQPQPLSS